MQEQTKGKRKAISTLAFRSGSAFKDRLVRKIVHANRPYIQWTYSVRVNHSYNDHCIFSPTIIIFSAVERKPGSLSSNNGIPTVRFFFDFANKKKEREREREKKRRN